MLRRNGERRALRRGKGYESARKICIEGDSYNPFGRKSPLLPLQLEERQFSIQEYGRTSNKQGGEEDSARELEVAGKGERAPLCKRPGKTLYIVESRMQDSFS